MLKEYTAGDPMDEKVVSVDENFGSLVKWSDLGKNTGERVIDFINPLSKELAMAL